VNLIPGSVFWAAGAFPTPGLYSGPTTVRHDTVGA
jgi:hypothetical protein